jgi:hypothetical protein
LDRRLGGPKTGLDAVEKRKISSPRRESDPRTPFVQPLASHYTEEFIILYELIFMLDRPEGLVCER